ncbi:MCE-family protein MCE3A [Mycobacterium sp. CBMA 234]|uniref:MCE family protein n=1 Tax=Mycolicibacterium sp. CBMA 234 TaxID=1918495 RepID=UPI0012DF2CEB|nr:MCE family protein [Mycolicibacterium sp. CBMA 234]MUL65951.1 MCE-family protein MCE3A [Mycolicibacterium sp. CBMA 234]
MEQKHGDRQLHPAWWTAILFSSVIAMVAVCLAFFAGTFNSYTPVTLVADRSGLVMETGAKVKMRGVEVGRVAGIESRNDKVDLKLDIFPDEVRYIPSNVEAQILATTAFGAKFVDFITPENPSRTPIAANTVVRSRNVATEVNTVFQNLVGLLHQVDVSKLNATLTAFADGVRGQGDRIGQATTDANQVLLALNPRMDKVRDDWRTFGEFSATYGVAAHDILKTLDSFNTTGKSIAQEPGALDAALLSVVGVTDDGIKLLAPTAKDMISAINGLVPTTDLLYKYNPLLTCTLVGAKYFLDHGGYESIGGNGRTLVVDAALLMGSDPYKYPDNLPIVGAKGGPDGKPSCGSLPDVSKNWPVRYEVTNTGWGTGTDMRPNPGIGSPGFINYFPTTRANPEPPAIRSTPGPALGPIPYPGAPAYGAKLYDTDGTPLWPGLPPAPPPGAPRDPGRTPGSEPFQVSSPMGMQPTPMAPPPAEPVVPSP